MKLYYPNSHYDKDYRGLVFPLLKAFIKGNDFTDVQRIQLYGVTEKDFQFTDILERADVVILTMAWNYYVQTKKELKAISFVQQCAAEHKKVIAFNAGDFGVKVPFMENLIILRPSGYKSKFTEKEYALPAFIADPLMKYYDADEIFLRPYATKPVVGFCGQANPSLVNASKEIMNTGLRNLKNYVGASDGEAQALLSTSYVRASVLKKLEQSFDVETNFIYRKQYRAGIKSNKDSHQTTMDFYNNLKDSDYVVCARGAGNFSVRLYETLAMGRIPIFIDTDCTLPLENEIDWKKHTVWIDYSERTQVAEKVRKFHNALTEKDFIALQLANRKIWQDQLTLNGFFKTLFYAQ